jgi:hypothetical protein
VVENCGTVNSPALRDINSIRDDWQNILSLVSTKLGPGTSSLLGCAAPRRFDTDVLILEFEASDAVKKSMCERNGRPQQIEALLSEEFSTPVKVKFEVAAGAPADAESDAARPMTGSERRNELLNDPAVKTVLMGLDATITGVEESQQK